MILLRHLLGDVLRRHRLRQGRTLREVSAAARISLGYLSEVERGQKEASSELLIAICDALGVRLADVLRDAAEQLAAIEPAPVEPVPAVPAPSMPVPAMPSEPGAREPLIPASVGAEPEPVGGAGVMLVGYAGSTWPVFDPVAAPSIGRVAPGAAEGITAVVAA